MDKKIGLISIHNDSDRVSSFQGKYLSMASMKLSGHLLQNGVDDNSVHIFPTDYRMNFQEIAEDISQKAQNLLLDYIGFTSYVWNTPKTLEVIQALLEINDKVKIIIGGPNSVNVDLNSDRVIKVIGKGEAPLLDIIRGNNFSIDSEGFYQGDELDLQENNLQNPLKGLYYSQELLQRVSGIEEIDTSFGWYETGSGCPYKCGFCSYDLEKGGLNPHDNDNVRREIENIKRLGIKRLFIIDPIFGVKKNRGKEILRVFNSLAPEVELLIFTRPEFLDEEYVDLLSQANIHEIRIGIQTLNPDVPKWLRSNNLTLVNKHLPLLSKNGIPWRAELIVGLIGDTMDGLRETYRKVINEFDPTFLYGYHLTIIKNTELAKYKDRFDQDTWIKGNDRGSAVESSSYTEQEMKNMLVYSAMLTSLHRFIKSRGIRINISIELLEDYMKNAGGFLDGNNIDFFLKADYVEAEKFWGRFF